MMSSYKAMFIATYEKGFLGGYGDRIVGMISVYVLADIFRRPFKILWTKECIRKHVDYAPWDAEGLTLPPYMPTHLLLSDEPHLLQRQLRTDPPSRLFRQPAIRFILNQELIRHLYKNPHFQHIHSTPYASRMIAAYQTLYTHIFPPTQRMRDRVTELVGNAAVVGIQLRGGDVYMNPAESHRVLDVASVPQILGRIAEHAGDGPVFITSDMGAQVYEAAVAIWGDRVIYNAQPVQHMDWTGGQTDAAADWKVYTDNYILAMCTRRLYITTESNYGRVAALAAPHADIWDLNCVPLAKEGLFSKHPA